MAKSNTTREEIDSKIEHNIGASLMKRFKADTEKEIDFGSGDIVKLKIPSTYAAYSSLLEQAKERFIESGQTDTNFIYVYLLESVITNLNTYDIQEIVFNAPGVAEILLKALDQASGSVGSRIELEIIEESKKKLKKTDSGE